ncbi:energy transducer TonB [Erythrobacter ani]|uniref:Energy transducer TonB n=1 Tax=Erythrobacter ani TaxID=2827235 RepID=A0ABS6SKS6_9SPHN|nr:energy transducer TonB [Erythrobacter ani]MBV7265102.1 energy transducer TonB [Erythrobacter ani]
METHVKTRYSSPLRRPRWWLVVLIILLHVAALYGLARALAPEFTSSVEDTVVSAFTVTITAPPDPPPPENEPEPDEGAQGAPGKEAVPQPVTAPETPIEQQPVPLPQASSTGTATRSGARSEGDGTGAAGSGTGTGSGNRGGGRGGVAVSKPVHISGGIDNARDYPVPEGGRAARRGTEVIVRVVVGVDGRARQCSVYRASPDPEADRITCQLVEDRLRFKPAQDVSGNPVPAPFYWRQRWF